MSARKSWDIAPKAPKTVRVGNPVAKPVSVRRIADMPAPPTRTRAGGASAAGSARPRAVGVSTKNVTLARGTKQRPVLKESLKKRRKKAHTAGLVAIGVGFVVILILVIYIAWLPALRVNAVRVQGLHDVEVEQVVHTTLTGTHGFVLPRNSIFFIPEQDIRANVFAAHPDIESLSISADGFTALNIATTGRTEVFTWCGASHATPLSPCFSITADGLVFAESANVGESVLRVFAPLADRAEPPYPGAYVMYAERIPETIRFIKALQTLGAGITTVAYRGDEADLYTRGGTRITYVLGREELAAGIAASVFPQLSLNDGSIQYVDLRFSGKAYFKRASDMGGDDTESGPALGAGVEEPVQSAEIVE